MAVPQHDCLLIGSVSFYYLQSAVDVIHCVLMDQYYVTAAKYFLAGFVECVPLDWPAVKLRHTNTVVAAPLDLLGTELVEYSPAEWLVDLHSDSTAWEE